MARIRSIHPGLFSDPEFADLTSDAQVFYLGLLTEADDNGVFEWKPSTLRIRLRPLKDGGVEPLLEELERAGKVKSFDMNGRKYGAIRNFRKFQRPKSPKSWHPIPPDFRNWVGLTPAIGEMPRDEPENDAGHFSSGGEIAPQMEEVGGRMKEEGGNKPAAATAREDEAFNAWNGHATAQGWRVAEFMTSTRRFRLAAVLDQFGGMEGWQRALLKAKTAQFIRDDAGQVHGWFTLDWLLDGDHIAKLLEGGYDERRKAPQGRDGSKDEHWNDRRIRLGLEALRQ